MSRPVPQCPIRPGEACLLCESGATGPEDCGLVWLVMHDPDLRDRLAELRLERIREQQQTGRGPAARRA
ncbi:DUF6767 domain-containing protein [Nocardioides sp.]|uniref:DUF6767 domain-containing protein n=1 Tax=Nocardioides sp. TaxID=35761 RepID=UPI003783288C